MTSLAHIKSRINMMPPESQVLAGKLLDEVEFMAKTLKKLKHEIETNPQVQGCTAGRQRCYKGEQHHLHRFVNAIHGLCAEEQR